MGNVQETEALLSKQRKWFLCLTLLISVISVAFLTSTIVLAIKFRSAYPSAHVEYHVWTHPDAFQATRNFKELKVPDNSTVYSVMEHGVIEARHFRFEFKQYEFGKYITSIGGVSEDVNDNTFWLLYKLSDSPNPDKPPSIESVVETGIDDTRVKDGDVYLFWRAKLDLTGTWGVFDNSKRLRILGKSCANGRDVF